MKALVSGEAAKLVVLGRTCTVYEANSKETNSIEPTEIHYIFSGCSDVTSVEINHATAAQQLVQRAWACDRALRLVAFLIDSPEDADDFDEYAECLEELLSEYEIDDFLLNRLISSPSDGKENLQIAINNLAIDSKSQRILAEVYSAQATAHIVSNAFEEVREGLFGGKQEKADCRYALVSDGSFRKIVDSIKKSQDLSFEKLTVLNKYRQFNAALTQWMAILQPGLKKSSRQKTELRFDANRNIADPDEYETRHSGKRQPERGRAALENVVQQQKLIIDEIKLGHIVRARMLTDQLILTQQSSSKPEHIAKTLDSLSQEAKELGATELQLEWAERAYRINPSDPLTSGHHADALICAGRIADAETAISRAEEFGNLAFAGNMRARILRIKGMYEAARNAYLENARSYSDDTEVWRSYVGAAECLRDLNRLEEAKREYEALVARWPTNATLRSGLASTLMEAGDFALAIRYFGVAIKNKGGIVPKSGQANAYKLAGNYNEAIKIYDECAREAPNSEAVLCGRAETFKAKGDLDGALRAFNLAVERAPFSVGAIIGKAEILEDLRRFEEAADTYRQGLLKFPKEESLEIGLARLLRQTHSLAEALLAFDLLQKRFPDNRWVAFNRADVLRRLGKVDSTLRAYDMLLEKWPTYKPAINAKISVLIFAKRHHEARDLIRRGPPRSTDDWRHEILQALLLKSEGKLEAAIDHLTKLVGSIPFARERKLFKAALASFNLERGHYRTAVRQIEDGLHPITNVIAFHAYAVSSNDADNAKAHTLYSKIVISDNDADIVDLSKEIARRFRVISEPPERNLDWISSTEQAILLREVA